MECLISPSFSDKTNENTSAAHNFLFKESNCPNNLAKFCFFYSARWQIRYAWCKLCKTSITLVRATRDYFHRTFFMESFLQCYKLSQSMRKNKTFIQLLACISVSRFSYNRARIPKNNISIAEIKKETTLDWICANTARLYFWQINVKTRIIIVIIVDDKTLLFEYCLLGPRLFICGSEDTSFGNGQRDGKI